MHRAVRTRCIRSLKRWKTSRWSGDSQIVVVDGNQLYGLTNHPKRSTRSTTNDLSAPPARNGLKTLRQPSRCFTPRTFRVPATLYVNWSDWYYAGQTDYSAAYPNKTIAQRVRESEGGE